MLCDKLWRQFPLSVPRIGALEQHGSYIYKLCNVVRAIFQESTHSGILNAGSAIPLQANNLSIDLKSFPNLMAEALAAHVSWNSQIKMHKGRNFKIVAAVIVVLAIIGSVWFDWYSHQNDGGTAATWLDVSPDGSQIVFSAQGNGGKDLFLLSPTTMKVTRLTDTPDYENCPAFSPDGKDIIFQKGAKYDSPMYLCTLDLSTRLERQLTALSLSTDSVARFTNDGKQIVFGRAPEWYDNDVYSMNPDGTDTRRLTYLDADAYMSPCSNSKGSLVWFCYDLPDEPSAGGLFKERIESVSASGTMEKNSINFGRVNADPYLFRSGKSIAFVSNVLSDTVFDVCICNTNGPPRPICLHTSKLVNWAGMPCAPADGHCVYFLAGNPPALWCINSDGSGEHQIASDKIFTDPMGWRASQ
jgi:hypothetical protein